MKVKVYVEGGGDGKALRIRCQQGFSQFFERAGLKDRMPGVVACGSRTDAFDRFRTAVSIAAEKGFPLLLVDSESEVKQPPWKHLENRDGWKRPDGATDDQAHLMVECMESWFLADVDCLSCYFGTGFVKKHVSKAGNVEAISKTLVFKRLKMATRKCQKCKKTGGYDKASHSFDLLGRIDPTRIKHASKHAGRLLTTLENMC